MSDFLVQFDALKRSLSELGDGLRRLELDEAVLTCGEGLLETGEATAAEELAAVALTHGRPGSPQWIARVHALRVRALFTADRYAECLALAREARAWPDGVADPEALGYLSVYEAASLGRLEQLKDALERISETRARLLRFPDSRVLAACAVNHSSILIAIGARKESRLLALDALVSSRRAGSDYFAGMALGNLAFIERQACHWAESERYAREASELYLRIGNSYYFNHANRSLALAQLRRGRLSGAAERAASCRREALLRGSDLQVAFASQLGAIALTHLGKFAEARALLEESSKRFEKGSGALRPAILSTEFLGDTYLESGDAERASGYYETAMAQAAAVAPRGDMMAELRRRRSECFLLLGKTERAHHEATEAIALCQEISDRYEEAAAYRVLALASAALGRHDEARATFDKGFSMYEDIETPYEWGKLWMSYGDWICGVHAGAYRDLNGAHEAYGNASNYLENIGAEFQLAEARRKLVALELLMKHEGALLDTSSTARPKPLRRPREIADLHRRGQWIYDQFGIVTRNKMMIDMLEDVARVAASDLPVLILGESGTGKELVAHGIHKLSARRGRFVPVNASALPDTMIEGELFGHMQGAFTNASREKEGLFEYASGGSIFLDEIGEMSVDLQAKLLRVLEVGEIRRVGGTTSIRVESRVIAATNRDRMQMESGDGFRVDLYYRLSHAMFELPPLRQRGDDVEFLIEHFLDQFCARYKKRVSISPEAMQRLVLNPWPGNVRQLRATLERLIVSARSVHTIMPRDVPSPSAGAAAGTPASLEDELNQKERQRILEALEKTQWVKADAARLLRMSRTTLITKMKRLGVDS